MYPTFTGSAKSKRQVNLSGRVNNPFAAYSSSQPSNAYQAPQNAVVHAQQERALREQERRRPPAAKRIQRTWRGHRSRRVIRDEWRRQWDLQEGWTTPILKDGCYSTRAECLGQLRLLAHCASSTSKEDIQRLHHFARRYIASTRNSSFPTYAETYSSFRLAKILVNVLGSTTSSELSPPMINDFLSSLSMLTAVSHSLLSRYSNDYFKAIIKVGGRSGDHNTLQRAVVALLSENNQKLEAAYSGFAWVYLTRPNLLGYGEELEELSEHISYPHLADALDASLSSMSNFTIFQSNADDSLLWLLSHFLYFHQSTISNKASSSEPNTQYIKIISRLISILADEIGKRIEVVDFRPEADLLPAGENAEAKNNRLPGFVRSQILSLVNQDNVSGLLERLKSSASTKENIPTADVSTLASYALTLLRVFPRRRSDIQLWLYRGLAYRQDRKQDKLPATRYFYEAASSTDIFRLIKDDPHNTVMCLAQEDVSLAAYSVLSNADQDKRDQQWRVILLFLELYTFILQIMDDEEFLSGSLIPNSETSWTKQSALPMNQLEALTKFLRNFAFALYWFAPEIAGEREKKSTQSLAAYFGKMDANSKLPLDDVANKAEDREVGHINGMTIASVKALVVGVLRMIYQRE